MAENGVSGWCWQFSRKMSCRFTPQKMNPLLMEFRESAGAFYVSNDIFMYEIFWQFGASDEFLISLGLIFINL